MRRIGAFFFQKLPGKPFAKLRGPHREFLECLLLQLHRQDSRFLFIVDREGATSLVRSFRTPVEAIVDLKMGGVIHVYQLGLSLHLCNEDALKRSGFRDSLIVETAWDHTTCAEEGIEGYSAQISKRDRIIAAVLRENEELKHQALANGCRFEAIEEKLGKAECKWRSAEKGRNSASNTVLHLQEEIFTLTRGYETKLESLRSFSEKVRQAGWVIRFCYFLAPSLTLRVWGK